MAERRDRRGRRPVAVPGNFYLTVFREAEATTLAEAAGAEGLADEVGLLRLLVRRQLESDPENVELVLKCLRVLVQMVKVQYGLSGADAAALEETAQQLARELAAALMGGEGADGGST